jgi:predicted amidohydrolase
MQDLKVALVQTDLVWENKRLNLSNIEKSIDLLPADVDVIILPEMFNTGFSMKPAPIAETMEGDTLQWMKKIAHQKNAALTGSVIIAENNGFYNRLIWMLPDGNFSYYDKKHLFTLAGEQNFYKAGNTRLIIEYKGWKICPVICYDLRFPLWLRNTENYDCLIVVANWPERRISHWEHLLVARAIENQSYVIGVNRVGTDGNELYYNGSSMVVNPMGKKMLKISDINTVVVANLKYDQITQIRKDLPFLNDRDQFSFS